MADKNLKMVDKCLLQFCKKDKAMKEALADLYPHLVYVREIGMNQYGFIDNKISSSGIYEEVAKYFDSYNKLLYAENINENLATLIFVYYIYYGNCSFKKYVTEDAFEQFIRLSDLGKEGEWIVDLLVDINRCYLINKTLKKFNMNYPQKEQNPLERLLTK